MDLDDKPVIDRLFSIWIGSGPAPEAPEEGQEAPAVPADYILPPTDNARERIIMNYFCKSKTAALDWQNSLVVLGSTALSIKASVKLQLAGMSYAQWFLKEGEGPKFDATLRVLSKGTQSTLKHQVFFQL